MHILDGETVGRRLAPSQLLPALERMFHDGCTAPTRHHHTINVPGQPDATLLVMPAWRAGQYIGIKLVTVFPGNVSRGLPSVSAGYLLMDGQSGTVLAMLDGGELTARRTAATSALAARYLARSDAESLLVVGTGRIARALLHCHVAVRPALKRVRVWGRTPAHAAEVIAGITTAGIDAAVAPDLGAAVATADIISSATLTAEPLIRGAWVRNGTHVDLVGGYTPDMREGDDELIRKARVFADTRDGALAEAGDLVIPVRRGLLDPAAVGDLYGLCRGTHGGRSTAEEITVFKSVGAALEDLAAAILVYESQELQ